MLIIRSWEEVLRQNLKWLMIVTVKKALSSFVMANEDHIELVYL